jgi:hypothetical protein
MVIML